MVFLSKLSLISQKDQARPKQVRLKKARPGLSIEQTSSYLKVSVPYGIVIHGQGGLKVLDPTILSDLGQHVFDEPLKLPGHQSPINCLHRFPASRGSRGRTTS